MSTLDQLAENFKERYLPLIGTIRKALAYEISASDSKSNKIMQGIFDELLCVYDSLSSKSLNFDTGEHKIEEILDKLKTTYTQKAARFSGFDQHNPNIMGKKGACIDAAAACEMLVQEWVGERAQNIEPLIQAINERELDAEARSRQAIPEIKKAIVERSYVLAEQFRRGTSMVFEARGGRK